MSNELSPAAYAGLSPYAKKVARNLEWVIVPAVLLVILGSFHLHFMLTAGDWDFWIDWKDREWWVTLTPMLAITYCGALHYILWKHFRLPYGATFAVTTLLLGEWIVRYVGFYMWSNFPMNMMIPAHFWPGAIALDCILLLTRSILLTSFIGGSVFALMFFPQNWAWLGAFHVPVEMHGQTMTIADLIGFEYIRTGTPEYIRIIERGTLRTFGQHSTPVSAFFSAFVCVFIYAGWWYVGKFFSNVNYFKGRI